MARAYAPIKLSVWTDDDFKKLSFVAQWVYWLANSQPNANYCGVVPYMPTRWARLSTGIAPARIRGAVKELAAARYVVLDADTEELWIRSFIKHNNVLSQPNVVKAMKSSYEHIASHTIKQAVYQTIPKDLRKGMSNPFGGPPDPDGIEEPFTEPLGEPNGKGLTEGIGEGRGLGSKTQAFDLEPQPESEPHPQPQPEPQHATTTALAAHEPAATAAGEEDEEVATPQEEQPSDPLVELILEICTVHRDKIMADALLVVGHLRRHLDDDQRVEEAFLWCRQNLRTRPGNPRFLMATITKWAARDGINIPPLPSIKRATA